MHHTSDSPVRWPAWQSDFGSSRDTFGGYSHRAKTIEPGNRAQSVDHQVPQRLFTSRTWALTSASHVLEHETTMCVQLATQALNSYL
jgi:hypothetical protein